MYLCSKNLRQMPKERKGHRIEYEVHATPNPNGGETTYHARRVSQVMREKDFIDHITNYSIISEGLYLLVLKTLMQEIPEQLLAGRDVHIKGLGTFYLKIKTRQKKITDAGAITARQLEVEGIGFTPDKEFNKEVRNAKVYFERRDNTSKKVIKMTDVIVRMTDYCKKHHFFTERALQALYGLSKYKANQICNQLVEGEYAKFTRERQGTVYHYHRVGVE